MMSALPHIILGLSGKKGSGKDTVADILCETLEAAPIKAAFADALYDEVSEYFGVSVEDLRRRQTKETPMERLAFSQCRLSNFHAFALEHHTGPVAHYIDWLNQPRSPREALQMWGQEFRRDEDPDYWVKILEQRLLQAGRPAIVTDVRNINERSFILRCGAQHWKIENARVTPTGATSQHVSETTMDNFSFDYVIHNDGTLDELKSSVLAASPLLEPKPSVPRPR